MKDKYMDFVKSGYYNYFNTRRIDKREAVKKIEEILKDYSESESYVSSDMYAETRWFRKIKNGLCSLSINGFAEFTFEEFKMEGNCDSFDDEWSFTLSCWRSENDREAYYKDPKARFSVSFSEYSGNEVSIDGIIWTKNPKNNLELVILTSQKI